jgi:DNA invertase Pin-like site-specific DNA recombinase
MSTGNSTPLRAAAYYRASTLKQEDSTDRQRSQVVPYAERKRYQIVREYVDEGVSGGEILKSRDFQRMLRDAQTGAFEVIVCDDKDRFGRFDAIDLGEVVAPLRRKGVRLDAVAQGLVDWESFSGRITDAVLQEAKNLEQEAISRRVLTNQLLKAQKGVTTGGRPPYGYRWEAGGDGLNRLVPDGHKAEVVRFIFERYDRGETLYAVAEELHRRGVASPRGGTRWTRSVVQRVLTNRRYVGDYTWGVHPSGKRHRYAKDGLRATPRAHKKQDATPQEEWIVRPDAHEPLIDRDTFERVQARLQGNRSLTTPHRCGGNFVLSRLLVCGHCGAYLVGVTEYGRRRFVCGGYLAYGKGHCRRNKVGEKALVNLLLKKLQEAFLDPDNLRRLREEAAALQAERRGEGNLSRLRRAADALEKKIRQGNERLLILPADRVAGAVETLRAWEAELKSVRDEQRRAEGESPAEDLEKSIAAAETVLWRLQEAWREQDAPLMRRLFREMLSKVELRWSFRTAGKRTFARLSGGMVHLQSTEASSELSPSAGPPRCSRSPPPPVHTDRPSPEWRRPRRSPPTGASPGTRRAGRR